eukprot:1099333-Pelagomonas_calceolata.AAC.1
MADAIGNNVKFVVFNVIVAPDDCSTHELEAIWTRSKMCDDKSGVVCMSKAGAMLCMLRFANAV